METFEKELPDEEILKNKKVLYIVTFEKTLPDEEILKEIFAKKEELPDENTRTLTFQKFQCFFMFLIFLFHYLTEGAR